MEKISGQIEISSEELKKIKKEIKNISQFKNELEKSFSRDITNLLKTILGGGIFLEASDLHIEPEKKKTILRVRIDGMLQNLTSCQPQIYQALLSRIKLLSGIKLNITSRPQNGRFSFLMPGHQPSAKMAIEIRVSTLPAEYGESIVMRILNPKSLREIEALGLRRDLLEIFKKEIKKPNGMIIVTGPTGSGKTTTLYAFLKKIQRPEIKIITIEDPIEYHLQGISQTQVAPQKGYDFANGLKSVMRQDPDVILVGEIRDLETAKTALQAALTGHLVLSTLHTNDAAGVVARLISLGANPANIGPAINLAIGQRLVKKVCQNCHQLKKASTAELKKIKKELKRLPKNLFPLSLKKREVKIPRIKGCSKCNFTGYRGRIGIFEAFLVDEEIEKMILRFPSITSLREKAIKKGMVLMKQDGLIKVLEGITTIEEVERMTGE